MPVTRRLDDQTYQEIVDQAKGRLPWLCPVWTDHNAHDPGITLLELMAWYKELQQYQMDQLTPSLRRCLLKLANVTPMPERDATVPLMVGQDCPARLPDERLVSAQDMVFELSEPIPARRSTLKEVAVEEEAGAFFSITSMLHSIPSFQPFRFAGRNNTALWLGFDQKPEDALRLWLEVVPPAGSTRNPPEEGSLPPRSLAWQLEGCGTVAPLEDETWNLSWSGRVTLPSPQEWSAGRDGLYWLRLCQTAPGCEEDVRLSGVFDVRYRARQRDSCAREHRFRLGAQGEQTVLLRSAQAKSAMLAVFLRTEQGWEQTSAYRERWTAEGRELTVDGSGAAQDGADNLLVASLDSIRARSLLFDAKGIPGERFTLELGGQKPLTEHLRLMCMTLEADGAVRPAPWTLVDDLCLCSPRDRVFAYDAVRECLVFGDGEHGSTVAPGPGSVMVTELILSHCGAGNIPEDAGLSFEADGIRVQNGAADGGRDAETTEACRSRLVQQLEKTVKCESADDYAACAMRTPGLRVAGAKALPGFDSRMGAETRRSAFVTVVVLPASDSPRPMPDAHFLAEVERQLERYRPVCICTRASAPRYVPMSISVELETAEAVEESVIQAQLAQWLAPCAERIGQSVRLADAAALLQKQPGVLRIRKAELYGRDQNSYRTKTGDLLIPQDALPALERVEVKLLRM